MTTKFEIHTITDGMALEELENITVTVDDDQKVTVQTKSMFFSGSLVEQPYLIRTALNEYLGAPTNWYEALDLVSQYVISFFVRRGDL